MATWFGRCAKFSVEVGDFGPASGTSDGNQKASTRLAVFVKI